MKIKFIKHAKTKVLKRVYRGSVSKIVYNPEVARRFSPVGYYQSLGEDVLSLEKREKEKSKHSLPRDLFITYLINKYKKKLIEKSEGMFNILEKIYKKNQICANTGANPPTHSNLLYLASSLPMLITAYRKIRPNKGATSLAYFLCANRMRRLKPAQKRFINRAFRTPDGISNEVFNTASTLLRKGKYPWGASRRIYFEKPGQPGKLRPITIPPFMDRIVQASILMVLEAIYEPWFEKRNRNFGFRPNKGVHDAIIALSLRERAGLFTAIEGDIKGAYPNVVKSRLATLLECRIKDRKFMNLLRDRLDYQYFDTTSGKYVEEKIGIPQGGIDSPYLWNIYMLGFDNFIHNYLDDYLGRLNKKMRGKYKDGAIIENNSVINLRNVRKKNIEFIKTLKKAIKEKTSIEEFNKTAKNKHILRTLKILPTNKTPTKDADFSMKNIRRLIRGLIQKNRLVAHRKRNIEVIDNNRRSLRYVFARYADDWIIIGNFNTLIAKNIKIKICIWLKENLEAELAEDKTLITDMRKKCAHFLGYELLTYNSRKLGKKYVPAGFTMVNGRRTVTSMKRILAKVAGSEIIVRPDKQRLIERLHMKGYCTKRGFPRELPWLSCLEPFAIVDRYNSVIRGFANFYADFITYPSDLYRWLYIVRFSCLKTLAQKYRISIKKVFKTFHAQSFTGRTITIKVKQQFNDETYLKEWKLLTAKEAITQVLRRKQKEKLTDRFYSIEKGRKVIYPKKEGKIPRVTDDKFLDSINWVNLRTRASLDLPCFLCGSDKNINMHHIRHIRKIKYSKLPKDKPWMELMALRNRKQIPVCRSCHLNKIHRGTHQGANLKSLYPIRLENIIGPRDNRLAHIESFVKPGREYFGKSIKEKGWVLTTQGLLKR